MRQLQRVDRRVIIVGNRSGLTDTNITLFVDSNHPRQTVSVRKYWTRWTISI